MPAGAEKPGGRREGKRGQNKVGRKGVEMKWKKEWFEAWKKVILMVAAPLIP